MNSKDIELVVSAFKNPLTGLTKNISKLKENNLSIQHLSNNDIKDILDKYSETFQRTKKVQKEKIFRSYKSTYVGGLLHMDLMTLSTGRNSNQSIEIIDTDYKYLLVCVDTYSRYMFVSMLENKTKSYVQEKVYQIIDHIRDYYYIGNYPVFTILTDSGGEFNIKPRDDHEIFKKSKNKYGAVLSEYWIYRIRDKVKLLDESPHKKITVEQLVNICKNINNTIASSVSDIYTPSEIFHKIKEPEKDIKIIPDVDSHIEVGDFVRVINYIEKDGKKFAKKSAFSNWSSKVFSVLYYEQDAIQNIYQYKLVSLDSKYILDMLFYSHELQLVSDEYVKSLSESEFEKQSKFNNEEKKIYNIRQSTKQDFNGHL